MKLIKQRSKIREWLANKLQGAVYRLDNTGNGDLEANGEVNFIRALGKIYRGKDFTFFDIGANRGDYTKLVLDHFKTSSKRVFAFEPQASCVERMEKELAAHREVVINHFGLSNQSGPAVLHKDFDQSGLASVYRRNLAHYHISVDTTESIELRKASDYIAENQLDHIDLVKIDVEGHELNVLAGFGDFLDPKHIYFIQFEYGGANLDAQTSLLELFTFLEQKGFKLHKMMPRWLEPRTYHPRLENFMYANYVAVSPFAPLS